MITIHLKDLRFRANHGVYAEETLLGGDYQVNVHVHFHPQGGVIRQLKETPDYAKIYTLIASRMKQPTPLLEAIAMEIAETIIRDFEIVEAAFVSVEKCNPPIEGMQGSVLVSFQAVRN